MGKTRVVVADDSSLVREMLRGFLESDSDIKVVGEAGNGKAAVDLVLRLKPDLVTMDLEMPIMNGMQAIEEIMATNAVPILVVSSMADSHNAYEAVARGALEAIGKPKFAPASVEEFVTKVKLLARVPVITHLRSRTSQLGGNMCPGTSAAVSGLGIPSVSGNAAPNNSRVFAIASSTGGPLALQVILPQLPANFPCPILVSQHISDGFAGGMAEWLDNACMMDVRLAKEGDPIMPGVVYISPSEANLAVTQSRRLTLSASRPAQIFHPSCNVLLNSVADVFGPRAVGIILTGMSSDGVEGIARIREKGGVTLAQDDATSVIYGMNRVAIETGAVQRVLPLEAFAGEMIWLADPFLTAAKVAGPT